MRQKLVYMIVGIALVAGMFALPPAPAAQAGSNGQQLSFFVPSGTSPISYIYVRGTYYTGATATWSKTFSPATSSYDLANYWWKYRVNINWKLANGVNGYCEIDVPKSMPGNWVIVDLSRYGGRGCYASY